MRRVREVFMKPAAFGIVLLGVALGQYWTGPYQLTSDAADDVNPAVCREWQLEGYQTCMVWQTNRNGDWDIYSRFCSFHQGNGWQPEMSVCRDSLCDDMDPAVCCLNDWNDHPSYWCVWERRNSPVVGRVMAAFTTFRDQWWPPVELGPTLHDNPADSAQPQVMAIRGTTQDTVWVVWHNRDTFGSYIRYTFHDGDTWRPPQTAFGFPGDVRSVRLGRGLSPSYAAVPLLVWEREGDVHYSRYVSGAWTTPQQVAHSDSTDRNPNVVSHSYGWWEPPSIVWESGREGDRAIFATPPDSFTVARRVCGAVGAGGNWWPCGIQAAFTTDHLPFSGFATWVSDRAGIADICSRGYWPDCDVYVDSNPANDINPCLTAMGATMVWCCWQSNRSGNWDLYGSYIYATGVDETTGGRRPAVEAPSVVRGELMMPSTPEPRPPIALRDISGRAVLRLRSGANSVRHLPAGVYFTGVDAPAGRSKLSAAAGKIVILR